MQSAYTIADTSITLRLLNALNSEDRGLKVRFSLATIVFETFELILCQMLSSQGKNAPSNAYPHYLVRLATSRYHYTQNDYRTELYYFRIIFANSPAVPEGQKHRVTTPETLGKSRGPPQSPAETPQNPRRDPAEPSERPPQSPLRGKFPRRASRRVVPLGW